MKFVVSDNTVRFQPKTLVLLPFSPSDDDKQNNNIEQ